MITADHVRTMARYNAWQNRQVGDALDRLGEAACRVDRGAFFCSILGTANHLLWGDGMWMSRFDGGAAPGAGISGSVNLTGGLADWARARLGLGRRILDWAGGLDEADLAGELAWHSGALGREVAKPMALCVVHMFNHQTHHRGQLHAMATAAGAEGWVSDLAFMPGAGPWP